MNHVTILLDAAARDPAIAGLVSDWIHGGTTDITAPRLARELRDRHLRHARTLVTSDTALFTAARRFESVTWPRLRHQAEMPATTSALHRHLFLARQAAEFPDSLRQFERICRHET